MPCFTQSTEPRVRWPLKEREQFCVEAESSAAAQGRLFVSGTRVTPPENSMLLVGRVCAGGQKQEEVSFPSADTEVREPLVRRLFQAVASLWKVTAICFIAASFLQEQASG